jgi:hypothetical protein
MMQHVPHDFDASRAAVHTKKKEDHQQGSVNDAVIGSIAATSHSGPLAIVRLMRMPVADSSGVQNQ